nr:DNA (cytosine-5)-methyltransferase DRM2-like [Tanacetum cinerariifolium]
MGDNASGEDYEDIDWNTEDELDITPSSVPSAVTTAEPIVSNGEASSSAGPSNYKVVEHFLGMGFSEELIERAVKDNGEANTDAILNSLLTYAHLEESPDEINSCNQQQQCVDDDSLNLSSDYDESPFNDLSESDSWSGSWSGSDAA